MSMVRTIILAVAVTMAASTMAWSETYYTLSNPRIIHVPQPGDDPRRSQASLHSNGPENFDDEDAAPPPRAQRAAKPQPKAVTRQQPKTVTNRTNKESVRRKPFSVSLPEPPPPEPEPTGPRRALLSAPPPPTSSLHDGPTPLRPTPRFGQPLPEAPTPLTTFTPPTAPKPVAAAMPAPEAAAPEPSVAAYPAANDEDSLPPPGDPRLAPPEPRD